MVGANVPSIHEWEPWNKHSPGASTAFAAEKQLDSVEYYCFNKADLNWNMWFEHCFRSNKALSFVVFLLNVTCLFLPWSLCCSWYSRLTRSISSHFSQQPVKLTKFLARISFSCRTLRSSMSSRQLRSDKEALRMATAASSGFRFRDKGKQSKSNQLGSFGPQHSSQHVDIFLSLQFLNVWN